MKFDDSIYVATIISMLSDSITNAKYIHPDLLNDKDFVLTMLTHYPLALASIPEKFKSDMDIILPVIKLNGLALVSAPVDIRDNADVVSIAVEQNGLALEYASDRLRSDRQIVEIAVRSMGSAIKYAMRDLQSDAELMLIAVTNDGVALRYANEDLRNNKAIVLAAVQQRGCVLKYASARLKNDRDVVYAAIKDDFDPNLRYADCSVFLNDLDLVLTSLYYYSDNRQYLTTEICALPEVQFMSHEVCKSGKELDFNDWIIVKKALLEQPDRFLNPPAIIKEFSDGQPNKYAILAHYALGTYTIDVVSEHTELPQL